jgi:hypothetical protein
MKLIYTTSVIILSIFIIPTFFSFTKPTFSSAPPPGYTGASGSNCTSCHSSFALNSGGGSVAAIGLPGSISLGVSYNFSAVITHGVADREKFGFAIKAVDANNVAVGTFSTTNPNAGVSNGEIGHRTAPFVLSTNSYTYGNLTWTAPTATPAYPITFYIAGNATNNGLGTAGDYIYTSTLIAVADIVPVTLSKFTAVLKGSYDVALNWRTEQETNSDKFEIEKSNDGLQFTFVNSTKAKGLSSTIKNYEFIDRNPSTNGEFIFYRLKMVDKDGSFKYSDIVKVSFLANETYIKNISTITSNNGNTFEVNILSPKAQSLNINWINTNGQLINSETKSLVKGFNNFKLKNTSIAKGAAVFLNFKTSAGFNKSYTLIN